MIPSTQPAVQRGYSSFYTDSQYDLLENEPEAQEFLEGIIASCAKSFAAGHVRSLHAWEIGEPRYDGIELIIDVLALRDTPDTLAQRFPRLERHDDGTYGVRVGRLYAQFKPLGRSQE
jgi:hypothetical protein